ncbi:hypothetical protein C9374_004772 [Naegleria lovaniensis]|uniref:Uncharacterized protein n=1 Tax=Naegleria lovaniensis TaxID=51637 RepID=A0AA88KKP2_NAELO|nr:uncharacterized protein C9374_004772 [Naegleria lovaniensis]KAG2382805.1 hypothetical protein C9374_004772 [Naegleria lovaniensis]
MDAPSISSFSNSNPQQEIVDVNSPPNHSSPHIKRRTSFKESLLAAVATIKPRKIMEKLSPRSHNNTNYNNTIGNDKASSVTDSSQLQNSKSLKNENIEQEEEIDLTRRSLDPSLLQVDRIRKENSASGKSKIIESHSLKRYTEFTALVRQYLNPHLVLHICDYISFPIGRFLSKTTKTPYKDDYLKLFFGKFNISFFSFACSKEIYLIFKNIIITDNYSVDFRNFDQLFRTVPLKRIESLAVLQFDSSCMSSSFAAALPKLLYHCISLKSLYINTEVVTGNDLPMIFDNKTENSKTPTSNDISPSCHSSPSNHKKRKNSKNHGNCLATVDPKTFETTLSSHLWSTLEELVIGERVNISGIDISNFKRLKQFTWRSLSETPSDGRFSFTPINGHCTLTTLELSKVSLEHTQLRNLFGSFPSLTNLKIEYLHSRLSHRSITYLQKNTTLKRLTLRYCKNADYNSGDVICISVANHPTLQYLDISGLEVCDDALKYLLVTNRNKLSILKAKGRLVSKNDDEPHMAINSQQGIQPVPVITGQGFTEIYRNQTITYLDLTNQPITSQGVEFIAQSSSIQHLVLRNCSLGNETIIPLISSQFPITANILSLDLSRNNLNDRFMFVSNGHLNSSIWQCLEQLSLSGNPMSTNVINGLTHMLSEKCKKSLKRLFVNGLNIRDAGFRSILSTFPNLEHIEAADCRLTNKSLLLLGHCKSLLKCKVNQNDFFWDKPVLQALFIENTMLESVGIVSQNLQTEKEFKRLAKVLKNNRNIQSLTINHCLVPKKQGAMAPSSNDDDSGFYIDSKAEAQFRIDCYHIGKIRFTFDE